MRNEGEMSTHDHGATANTLDSPQSFIGCKVSGVMRAISGRDGGFTIVFDCGWGLTFSGKGAFWCETPDTVKDAKRKLKELLRMAG